jgi:hypothetical protein
MATVRDRAVYGPLDKQLDQNNYLITPSDTVNLSVPPQAIKVGATGGNITMIMPDGTSVVMAVSAGDTQYVNGPIRIMSTGTTATTLTAIVSKALR